MIRSQAPGEINEHDDRDEMTSRARNEISVRGSLGRLSAAALIAALASGVGSLGLMFRTGQRSPGLLLVLFTLWVLAPFVALVVAHVVSKRWSVLTRATLYIVMLIIALGSMVIYGDDALGHRRPQAAFVYVAVPPASWLLMAIVVPLAALISRRQSRKV